MPGGLVLVVENESIAFGLDEQPEKTLHQPTLAELQRRDERMRGGLHQRFLAAGSPSSFTPTHAQGLVTLTVDERVWTQM
jgi:hypothetical protein